MDELGWGVIGTGAVATQFARALAAVPGARRRAVASGRAERARAFARAQGFAAAHGDIAALLANPAVDIVYIASPTRLHREHALAAIAAGKAVLCEKPFGVSAADAEAIAAAARAAGVFCMEAMWLRFSDTVAALRAAIGRGAIGRAAAAAVSVGYAKPADSLGGPGDARGALPVFGCYALSLAIDLFGPAGEVRALMRRDGAGVETDVRAVIGFGGVTVTIDASVSATRANRLEVVGAQGIATIPANLIDPTLLVVRRTGAGGAGAAIADALLPVRARMPAARRRRGSGMRGEIGEAMRCVNAGLTESPRMPLADTIAVHRLLERIRAGG